MASHEAPQICHLFRLPPELRLQIYELALGRHAIHIWTRPSKTPTSSTWPHKVRTWNTRHVPDSELRTVHLRTGHAVCSNPDLFQEQYQRSRICPVVDGEQPSCIQACSSTTFRDLTGIIFTCRKAYYEARFLPYELYTFVFINGFHAEFFFRVALSPDQRARTRNLHFEGWECEPDLQELNPWADLVLYSSISTSTVAKLTGLRRLTYRDLDFDSEQQYGITAFRKLKLSHIEVVLGALCDGKLEFDRCAATNLEQELSDREGDDEPVTNALWCCEARCRDLWAPYDWKDECLSSFKANTA